MTRKTSWMNVETGLRAFAPLVVLVAFWVGSLAGATALAAPTKPVVPAAAGTRFLFVVETSSGMSQFEHAGRQAVFDLLYFGIGEQMRAGDTVGLWTFGNDVRAGVFPMQVWAPEQNLQLASAVGVFLRS